MSNRWKAGFIQAFFDPLTVGPALPYGALYTWGDNGKGETGQNEAITIDRSSPVQVGSLTNWVELGGGRDFFFAINDLGQLYAWGSGNNGRLGLGDTISRSSPVQVGALTNWSKIDGGSESAIALKTDGTIWTGGGNSAGQLGQDDRTARNSPVQVGSLTTWSKIAAGGFHNLVIKTDGTLWTWGSGTKGQLGLGTAGATFYRSSPVQVGALTTWFHVSAGGYYSSGATTTDNKIYLWGRNNYGQLGDNSIIDRSSPVQVGSLTNWESFSGSSSTGAAIKTDGTLWAWGGNSVGEVGNNTTVNCSSPVQVGSDTNWQLISFGMAANFHLGIKTDGTLWSWGSASRGQLGQNSSTVNISSPTQIGSETSWRKIAVARRSSMASESS